MDESSQSSRINSISFAPLMSYRILLHLMLLSIWTTGDYIVINHYVHSITYIKHLMHSKYKNSHPILSLIVSHIMISFDFFIVCTYTWYFPSHISAPLPQHMRGRFCQTKKKCLLDYFFLSFHNLNSSLFVICYNYQYAWKSKITASMGFLKIIVVAHPFIFNDNRMPRINGG